MTEFSSGGSRHLSERVKKIIESDVLLSPDFLFSLPYLKDLCDNSGRPTVSVLGDGLGSIRLSKTLHSDFLVTTEDLEASLKSVDTTIVALKKDIQAALLELDQVRRGSAKTVEKAQTLNAGRTHCQIKRIIAQRLVERLKVSDDTIRVFRNSKVPTTVVEAKTLLESEFFVALDNLLRVHRAAKQLRNLLDTAAASAARTEDIVTAAETISGLGKTAVTDVLQETARLLFLALETVFGICQAAVRSSNDPATFLIPEHTFIDSGHETQATAGLFCKAIAMLQLRQDYYSAILLDIARKRRVLLQERFQESLTTGGRTDGGGIGRPIELHAFETPRYIGDMLAFVHGAAISEREFLELILHSPTELDGELRELKGCCKDTKDVSPLSNATTQSNGMQQAVEPSVASMLDSIFLGIVPTLRSRAIQALLRSKTSPVELCRTQQVLQYYIPTLSKIFEEDAAGHLNEVSHDLSAMATETDLLEESQRSEPILIKCCKELEHETQNLFFDAWESQILRLSSLPTSTLWTPDFSAPQFLHENVNCLAEVLHIFECSPSLQERTSEGCVKESVIENTINAAVTPLLNFCRQASQYLPKEFQLIYVLNCYSSIQHGLCRFPAAAKHVEICAELIAEQSAAFAEAQTQKVLDQLGFSEKLEALRHWNQKSDDAKERQPLSSVSVLHPLALGACLRAFYNSLFASNALSLTQIDQITSRSLRSEIRRTVLTNIANAYEEIYNGTKGTGAATHTPEQIRALLDI